VGGHTVDQDSNNSQLHELPEPHVMWVGWWTPGFRVGNLGSDRAEPPASPEPRWG